MKGNGPTVFTLFFLAAIELMACSLVVSGLAALSENEYYEQLGIDSGRPLAVFSIAFASILLLVVFISYSQRAEMLYAVARELLNRPTKRIQYSKIHVFLTLLFFWLSLVVMYIPVVDHSFRQSSDLLPVEMLELSFFLLIIYILIEFLLLRFSNYRWWRSARVFLYLRFVILGNAIQRLESGWQFMAVKFFDVLFATWLMQVIFRMLWNVTKLQNISDISYFERLLSPAEPANGTIINSFSSASENVSIPLYFSGHQFGMDVISSIFSLLWNHWMELLAIWFILEALGFLQAGSRRLSIVNASDGGETQTKKEGEKEENGEPKNACGPNLADLLATELDRIKKTYQSVDEERPIQTACGAGEPINAAIKVDRLDDISLGSSEIKLGPFGIPVSSVSALISHILMGPKITIGLYSREQDDAGAIEKGEEIGQAEEGKTKQVLIASLSGNLGSQRWVVESREPLEGESRGKERSIEDKITEMAHRIHAAYSEMQSKSQERSNPWRALWNYNEGLRAYRDSLKTKKKHKYHLNRAEKKFIDAIKEDSSFSLANYNLGVVYAELDQLDSAEECFQKAIDMNPDLWEAYYALGISFFRRAKDVQQSHEILCIGMQKAEKGRIIEAYERVIHLCEQVLEIKFRNERIIGKDFSDKARAYDLMGNAWARLACIKVERSDDGTCDQPKKCDINCLMQAKECLEKSVNCSWRALLTESILHETAEDETRVVSECTLDLAHVYLKLSEPPNDLRPKMRDVLMNAIYIDPSHIPLYHLLARVGDHEKCSNFMRRVYEQIRLMDPDSSRVAAHLAAIKIGRDTMLTSWLKECRDCCDEQSYERVYHFLANAINDNDCTPARRLCFEREKLCADLTIAAGTKKREIAAIKMKSKKAEWKDQLRICLSLCRQNQDFAFDRKHLFKWNKVPGRDARRVKDFLRYRYYVDWIGDAEFKKVCNNRIEAKAGESSLSFNLNCNEIWVDLIINGIQTDKFMAYIEASGLSIYECGCRLALFRSTEQLEGIKENFGLNFRPPDSASHVNAKTEMESNTLYFLDCMILLGSIFAEVARMTADNLSASLVDLRIGGCTQDLTDGYKKLSGIEQTEKYINMASEFMLCAKSILMGECISFDIMSPGLHKREICSFMMEAGETFLTLGKVSSSIDIEGSRYNKLAMELFEKAIGILENLDPKQIKRSKIRMHLARTCLACGRLPNALKEAQNARELNPLDYEVRKVLGEIFCELEEYRLGLAELNAALSYKPDDPEILFCTGRAYLKAAKDCKRKGKERTWLLKNAKEKLEEALEILDRSNIKYRGKIRYWIGWTLIEMGSYEEAIPHLRILADKDKGDFLPALFLAFALFKCNSHEECESRLYGLIRDLKNMLIFLFSWDKVCGDDSKRLRALLNSEFNIDCGINLKIEKLDDTITIKISPESEIKLKLNRLNMNVTCEYDKKKTVTFIAKNENCRINIYQNANKVSFDNVMVDGFLGRQYEDERHITEILASAYIYLAYSYAERDANMCGAWKLAFESKYYVDRLREKIRLEEERARDDVMPDTVDISFMNIDHGLLSVPSPNGIKLSDLADLSCIDVGTKRRLLDGYSVCGMDDYRISINPNPKDGLRKRKSKAHLAECAGIICYKLGELDKAEDYLTASIALWPDAGAYINLAKAYERRIICRKAGDPEISLIRRKIRDLCRHAETLDIRDEHKDDLAYFIKMCQENEKGSNSNSSPKEPS